MVKLLPRGTFLAAYVSLNCFKQHLLTVSRSLHSILLTNNVRGANKCPRKFKTEQNYIRNDAIGNFTPLPPILTSEYIDNLVDYINNYEEMTPILQAGIAHVQSLLCHCIENE